MTLRRVRRLKVHALGMPRPQGSMTPMLAKGSSNRIFLKAPSTTMEWRAIVTGAATKAMKKKKWRTHDGPIILGLVFTFARPKSMPKWQREHVEKFNGADLDKLCRAIGDALGDAGVYTDDRQIQRIVAEKRFGDTQGAHIVVTALEIDR